MNQILNDASKRAAPGGGGQTAPASRPATIERLSVFDLVPSEDNFYSMNDIEELKSKIELAGKVLQNFIVVPLGGGKYKVISGHRRRAACIGHQHRSLHFHKSLVIQISPDSGYDL